MHRSLFEIVPITDLPPVSRAPITLSAAWAVAGYYPTCYCIRYIQARDGYAASLEGFVKQAAA